MATVDELEKSGHLIRINVPLDGGEQTWRRLYGTPGFVGWLDAVLPSIQTTVVGGDFSPLDQLDARFYEYVIGDEFRNDRRFKSLTSTPDHYVWEFKTLDLRVFGWVPFRDCFICTFGDTKDNIELLRLYGRYIAQTVYERDQLPLDDPKCIISKVYEDAISNAN